MTNDELFQLYDQRAELSRLMEEARATIESIDTRIRLESGHDADDFSGAVKRLRDAGVLPPKKV